MQQLVQLCWTCCRLVEKYRPPSFKLPCITVKRLVLAFQTKILTLLRMWLEYICVRTVTSSRILWTSELLKRCGISRLAEELLILKVSAPRNTWQPISLPSIIFGRHATILSFLLHVPTYRFTSGFSTSILQSLLIINPTAFPDHHILVEWTALTIVK
jgi:hypothetical protein